MKQVSEFCQRVMDEKLPGEWSLRGDIFFWNLLRAITHNWLDLKGMSYDTCREHVLTLTKNMYRQVTGVALEGAGRDFVPFFKEVGYGMTAGYLDRVWWTRTVLPELERRIERICGDCTDGELSVYVLETDILKREDSAIVCPTNTSLNPEGGLARAILDAAGQWVESECEAILPEENGERCPVGDVRKTGAGNLRAKCLLHTVAPNCQRGMTEKIRGDLHSCYVSVVHLADELKLESLAMPSIGTGKNAFPVEEAAKIAAQVVVRECRIPRKRRFVFCIPDKATADIYRAAVKEENEKYNKG